MHLGTVVLALLLFALPLVAGAQQAGKVPVVGYLLAGPRECKLTPRDEAFYQGLRDLGYVRSQNITVDQRCYLTADQARKILSEFVDRRVDVVFVGAPEPAIAARTATRDIPIVCGSCGDPLENGLVASLAWPGGKVTGMASQSAELAAAPPTVPVAPETVAALMRRVTGVDITRCPVCRQGRLRRVGVLPPGALPVPVWDTS